MTDFLEAKHSEIRVRLDKLAPAVQEYARLVGRFKPQRNQDDVR